MDASEPLLLSEGVCRQLGIVTYHPEVDASQTPAQEIGATVSVPTERTACSECVVTTKARREHHY